MKFRNDDGRLLIEREEDEKRPIMDRLSRIEGQVRGLRQMVETNRYCGEIVQQAAAVSAALREVVLLCLEDHLDAGIEYAGGAQADAEAGSVAQAAVAEIATLLRSAMKQQAGSL